MDTVRRSRSVASTRNEEEWMSAAEVGTRWPSSALESVQGESEPPSTFEYWLAHCEGYRVDSPGGRVGIVEDVHRAEGVERAESLAVLAGMFGRRRLIIEADQVNAIVPHEQCVLLKANANILRTELRDSGSPRRRKRLASTHA
jgi:hypothetical protein